MLSKFYHLVNNINRVPEPIINKVLEDINSSTTGLINIGCKHKACVV